MRPGGETLLRRVLLTAGGRTQVSGMGRCAGHLKEHHEKGY
jgi:hypothetical protein